MKDTGKSLNRAVTLIHSILEKKRTLGACDPKL